MHDMLTRGIWNVLEVDKLNIYLCIKLTVWCNELHNALHMVYNVGSPIVCRMVIIVRHFVYETFIATSS